MPAELNTQRMEIRPNSQLSDFDKAYTMINYPRVSAHPDASDWSLDRALDFVGLSGEPKTKIKSAFQPERDPSAAQIRAQFSIWSSAYVSGATARVTPTSTTFDGASPTMAPSLDSWCKLVLPSSSDPSQPAPSHHSAVIAKLSTFLWLPGATVRYCFQHTGETYHYRANMFRFIINDIKKHAYLNFEEVEEPAKADVRIAFDASAQCSWSYPGTACPKFTSDESDDLHGSEKNATLLLNTFPAKPSQRQAWELDVRKYYHEAGHMLGLLHEQNVLPRPQAT